LAEKRVGLDALFGYNYRREAAQSIRKTPQKQKKVKKKLFFACFWSWQIPYY